jgi:uncharacterized protein YrzB (UPF0473 family)
MKGEMLIISVSKENMSTFNKGELVALSDDSNEQFMILECIEKNEKEYMLLSPAKDLIDENQNIKENARLDHSKLIIVSFNNLTGEFKFENDKNIIQELVEKAAGEL